MLKMICGNCGSETEVLVDTSAPLNSTRRVFRCCMRCNPQARSEGKLSEPCKRSTGAYRAHFRTREDAETFAQDPANHPVYLGDVAHKCGSCGWWHLSRPEWLAPAWLDLTAENAAVN
jgi:hypothetical protein